MPADEIIETPPSRKVVEDEAPATKQERPKAPEPTPNYESKLKGNKMFGKFNKFISDFLSEPVDQKNEHLEYDELKQIYKAMLMWNKILF